MYPTFPTLASQKREVIYHTYRITLKLAKKLESDFFDFFSQKLRQNGLQMYFHIPDRSPGQKVGEGWNEETFSPLFVGSHGYIPLLPDFTHETARSSSISTFFS